ncbi:DoxX family protein [Streptomyces sp. NPDC020731]|uniref:DoxX family protein n=1 Tax=Streptomyces sp. NPDC020731 TaxID=3365085 RepID=UPI00379DF919
MSPSTAASPRPSGNNQPTSYTTRWTHPTLPAVRALGTVETLGAAGLILPPLTGIAPSLASAAAIGFVLLQIGAIAVHLTGEDRRIALNVGLTATAAMTIWLATGL